ncbi:hypothetical protein [Streptomyces sp. ISL-94]|uniref:hypothetical protein n=1 Tax=Streptomyces sp. ISL-94 TaxID=2819190 RepID=UPI001BE73D2C|nr:hypothetical protein [Streptomyces sp. ISL-94]MBT2480706.1 hypothetical protein [Streptomyces sp. ISL-94]
MATTEERELADAHLRRGARLPAVLPPHEGPRPGQPELRVHEGYEGYEWPCVLSGRNRLLGERIPVRARPTTTPKEGRP